jgi:myo-inositol 2-dehydrogenase / D-chiro-inositol 1-dehydrogenase
VYASVAEMLDGSQLDGVLIAAPTDRHGEIIAEVAARGLPILCEKPCGLTSAQASAAARTAAAAGVPLQVAYWRRYVPVLQAARDRMEASAARRQWVAVSEITDRPRDVRLDG